MPKDSSELVVALILFVVLVGVILLYFAPSMVAKGRYHKNTEGVFILNLLLGWTLIGWTLAMIWATLKSEAQEPPKRKRRKPVEAEVFSLDEPVSEPIPASSVTYSCPYCRASVSVPAVMLGMAVSCSTCHRLFSTTPPTST